MGRGKACVGGECTWERMGVAGKANPAGKNKSKEAIKMHVGKWFHAYVQNKLKLQKSPLPKSCESCYKRK